MSAERHYSTFEIDVAWAEGLASHPDLEGHFASCAECSAYVDELRALEALPPPASVPAQRRRGAPKKWMALAVATLALAAGVVLFLRQRTTIPSEQPGTYVGVKGGTPASMLLVKRGDVTRPWDGREPIRPADVVAVHVACEGYRSVTVLAKDEARWVQIAANDCPSEAGVLPFTLVVDERPGDEEIRIVFTRENGESTTNHFVLPKESSR